MPVSQTLPEAKPYYLPAGETGCILTHGFTSSPAEIRPLGDYLQQRGFSVLAVRLSGHGTTPRDLGGVRWQDWLSDIEDAFHILQSTCEHIYLVGQSLGGMLSLTAAAYLPVAGVVTLSAPFLRFDQRVFLSHLLFDWMRPMVHKVGVKEHPQWGIRREANYPAYATYPQRIFRQIYALSQVIPDALPHIQTRVLLLQSRADGLIPPDSMQQYQAKITGSQVESIWLDGIGHGMSMDPQSGAAFEKIAQFLLSGTTDS